MLVFRWVVAGAMELACADAGAIDGVGTGTGAGVARRSIQRG
jgi:hypothetical protein